VDDNQPPGIAYGGCALTGIPLSNDRHLANLGSILFAFIAILVSIWLILRSERKKAAAVGRREMQIFLMGYVIIEICEIFSVGGFPLNPSVRKGFSAAHIAAISATCWILFLNALVGFQLLDDGTPLSIALLLGSAAAIAIGTGYIALDVGFSYTNFFDSTHNPPNRAIGLYVLYQLFPLVCLVVFFILECDLVLRVLGEKKPLGNLVLAALLFAIGQIFQYVISVHLCDSTNGKINGAMFETLFTFLSVVAIWKFWSEITEDDWPSPISASTYP
jgi:Chitin synthase export chaperone